MRWQDTRRISRVNAGLFDMFHDAGDEHLFTIADRIDIDFDRVSQICVDEDRAGTRDLHGHPHIPFQGTTVVDDFHCSPAQDIGRPDEHRITNLLGDHACFVDAGGEPIGRLAQLKPRQQLLEALAIFCKVDRVRRGAEDGDAGLS